MTRTVLQTETGCLSLGAAIDHNSSSLQTEMPCIDIAPLFQRAQFMSRHGLQNSPKMGVTPPSQLTKGYVQRVRQELRPKLPDFSISILGRSTRSSPSLLMQGTAFGLLQD